MRAKAIIEKMIENPEVAKAIKELEAEDDRIRAKLNAKVHAAQTAGTAGHVQDLYREDPEYAELYDRLNAAREEKHKLWKRLHRQRQVVGDYIRFGELPTTRSRNSMRAKNDPRRWEAGISVYPALYDKDEQVWVIDDNEIYSAHVGTTDNCICDFEDGKIKAYLIKGTELLGKNGSDGEPLLDPRSLKIVKELSRVKWDSQVYDHGDWTVGKHRQVPF